MSYFYDREHSVAPQMADWLKTFADNEIKSGNNYTSIQDIFKKKNDLDAVEAKVNEIRARVGLDLINDETVKTAQLNSSPEQEEYYGTISTMNLKDLLKSKEMLLKRFHNLTAGYFNKLEKPDVDEAEKIKLNKIVKALVKIDHRLKEIDQMQNSDDALVGGLGDDTEDKEFDKKQLEMGIEVEKEHTPDLKIRKEISKDHLTENKNYYDYLKKMEKKMDSDEKKAQFVVFLTKLAQEHDSIGDADGAMRIDELTGDIASKLKTSIFDRIPEIKEAIKIFITSRGGEVDNLAVKEKIMKEFDGLISERDLGEIFEYIKKVKSELPKNKEKKRVDLSKFDQTQFLSDTDTKEEGPFNGR
jgi:hypothetical protein